MWWAVFKDVTSTGGSVLFIGVVLLQGRMYGWRTWVEYGLGTGKPVHQHPQDPREPMCLDCPVRKECSRE